MVLYTLLLFSEASLFLCVLLTPVSGLWVDVFSGMLNGQRYPEYDH